MNQINSKIYYLIETGKVLAITSEMMGDVEPKTKEFDMSFYDNLKDKSIDDVDYIELEYGTLGSTFVNVKSYSVNLETKTLDIIYITQEEIDAENAAIAEEQLLQTRISTITSYMNLNTTSVDDIENAIIQYELNNIENGVI